VSATAQMVMAIIAGLSLLLNALQFVERQRHRHERKKVSVKTHHVLQFPRDQDRFSRSLFHMSGLGHGSRCTVVTVKYSGPHENKVVGVYFRIGDSRDFGRHHQVSPRTLRDGYTEYFLVPETSKPEQMTAIVVYFEHGPEVVRLINWRYRLRLAYTYWQVRRMQKRLLKQEQDEDLERSAEPDQPVDNSP